MNNKTYEQTADSAKPVCRITTLPDELCGMVEAVLYDIFRFTRDEGCDITVSGDSESVTLTSPDGTVSVRRPISASSLKSAAMQIAESAKAYRYSADPATRSAILGEESVVLTETEFRLYSAILENRGNFTSAEELSMAVWGRYDRNLCTVYISYLRRKLDGAFGDGTLITASGKGYRLRDTSI